MTARDANTERAPGTGVMPRPMPVPAPPPGLTDVLRRSARLGLGALGLASRAAGSVFARVPDGSAAEQAEPAGPLALLPGAVLGLAIEAERRAATVVDAVAERTAGVGRRAARPAIVQRALRPVEDALWHWNEVARREQTRNQAQAAALIPVIVQQVTENVIAQIDFVRVDRADPGRRHRRRHRRRGDRAADRPRRGHPRVHDGAHDRGGRCRARAGDRSRWSAARAWSTDSCSGGRERDVELGPS